MDLNFLLLQAYITMISLILAQFTSIFKQLIRILFHKKYSASQHFLYFGYFAIESVGFLNTNTGTNHILSLQIVQ